jgi:hypothetical protein
MRNHAVHRHILNRNFAREIVEGVGSRSGPTSYVFRFSNPLSNPEKKYPDIEDFVSNPRDYFQQMFGDLVEFVSRMRRIMSDTHDSSQHRNELDFEL